MTGNEHLICPALSHWSFH